MVPAREGKIRSEQWTVRTGPRTARHSLPPTATTAVPGWEHTCRCDGYEVYWPAAWVLLGCRRYGRHRHLLNAIIILHRQRDGRAMRRSPHAGDMGVSVSIYPRRRLGEARKGILVLAGVGCINMVHPHPILSQVPRLRAIVQAQRCLSRPAYYNRSRPTFALGQTISYKLQQMLLVPQPPAYLQAVWTEKSTPKLFFPHARALRNVTYLNRAVVC